MENQSEQLEPTLQSQTAHAASVYQSQPLQKQEPKQWVVALLLCFFLGTLGAHRFYMGHTISGIIMLALTILSPFTMLISLGITTIWAFIDFIRILIGSMKSSDGSDLKK